MGSGTTAIACKNLNRNFLGFEQNPKWHKVALDRLKGLALCQNTKDFEQQTLFDFF